MSTPYDYITINTPTGGTSTTYSGTQISVNTPAISDVTKAEVSFTSSQSLNGYSYPWADGTGTNQMTGSNRMRDWEITGSGDVVNFYPYQMSSPQYLSRLTTTIVPQQSGSGDPSPTNIRPITGFDSVTLWRTGKNLLPPYSTSGGTSTSNGITFTYNSNGSITASGTATANAFTVSPSGFRLPPGTYKKNAYDSTKKIGLIVQKKVTSSNWVTVGVTTSDTFTLTEEDAQYELAVRMRVESGATLNSYSYTPIIRLPDTTDASELYNGNTYSVSFGSAGTVYGGTLDVISGELKACPYYSSYNGEALTGEWISDRDVYAVGTTPTTGAQVVNIGGTLTTYQLTATQVAMITGNNYIWTNCGTITDAGYKLTSSNNDTLTYLYAPNAGLCTGKMPTTIGLGFTYNYLSFEYYSTQAVDIDVYICGTDAKWYDTTYNRTKYVKWDTFSLPAKTSYTKYTLPTRSISLSDLTEGSGDVNSVYFEIVPTTNSPSYPMRIQHVQVDHNSASTTYAPSQNRCTYSGASSVTLYKRSTQSSSYENSYYKYLNTTVYNGSFEYITGKVTKTYVSITLNSSDLTWAVYNDSSTSRAFRATISDMKSLSHSSYDSARCFCTHASWTTSSERLGFGKFYYSYGYVYFPDYSSKRFNSVDEFTAWLDLQESRGTPVTILYPLSTPTETTVYTTTIKTLAGQNYFDTSSTAANRLPLTMTILQTSFMLPRPLNFAVQREDIYAGQYTTCTGATRADCIGWKYSDMTWSWDGMKQSDVEKLCGLTGECTLIFDDPSGDTIEESFIRSSVVSMRCRNKFEDEYWWTGVSCSISFIDSHTD